MEEPAMSGKTKIEWTGKTWNPDAVTLKNLDKAPFPWFGGKSKAAPLVWALLGDVDHYVEPFAGSLAVLLGRPHPCNRTYYSETVNDLDGFIVNAWRAIQMHPEAVADAASWPVTEADKSARQIACQLWRNDETLDLLAGDPLWCDPVIAGWWLWGVCVQIGAIGGPWTSDPVTGRIVKQDHRDPLREPGVSRDLPHLTSDGRGVTHAGTREPGVSRLDRIADDTDTATSYHPLVMPELVRWMRHLSARLRHVRILNGDWARTVTTGAAHTLTVRMGDGGAAGVFLDPPYDSTTRAAGLYGSGRAGDSGDVASDCLRWCLDLPDDPKWRVVLAGYDTEHGALEDAGWTSHEWFTPGFLTGGMGSVGDGHQQHRERLWASPHCLDTNPPAPDQTSLF